MTEITANFDEPWKEAIGEYFESCMSFFFSPIHELIDWDKPPISLEKELQQITASSDTGKRLADKLFQVWLLDNREIWILIHIEVQSKYESDFAQRMFIYNYRAFDLYRKTVVSLAILGDERPSWRPNSYNYGLGGCEVRIQFPIVKLWDYQWEVLEQSNNPFALVVMAHLKTKATKNNLTERERWKWTIVRSLYEKGYNRQDIIELFKVIDLMMTLPEELQSSFEDKLNNYEESRTMPLLSNMERRGMEKGIEEGMEKGIEKGIEKGTRQNLRENIIGILAKRFGTLPNELVEAINKLEDIPQLKQLVLETVSVNSVVEFEQLIQREQN